MTIRYHTSITAKAVHFDEQYLHVELTDRRILSTPIEWYPELQQATLAQLKHYTFICRNTGIEWPELDYQLSVEAMFVGSEFKKAA